MNILAALLAFLSVGGLFAFMIRQQAPDLEAAVVGLVMGGLAAGVVLAARPFRR